MRVPTLCAVILLAAILSVPPALAGMNTVPSGGTVFLGEQGLDISATGIAPGSQIVWYGPGGNPSNVPAATLTVDDPTDFYISPVLFGDRTGPWFSLPGSPPAFYVQDPVIELRVIDETRGFQITGDVTWIPKGDAAGFRVDTNVYEIAKRPGSPGAPLTIRVRGPGGVEYSSLDGYSLEEILISGSPFQTGPVWFTGDYERGDYTVWAESTGNDMNLNYKREGKTVTPPVTLLIQSTNPLITPEPTTASVTTAPTTLPTTTRVTSPTATATTMIPTTAATSPTPSPTMAPTTVPVTTIPGFGTLLSLSALGAAATLGSLLPWRRDP